MKNLKGCILILLTLFLQGCGIGYDRVLLVTSSNIGIDLDSTPSTAEIAISRKEGVIQPTFENGKTLPVAASFYTNTNSSLIDFAFGVSTTLTTGQAAIAMTALYNEDDAVLMEEDATLTDFMCKPRTKEAGDLFVEKRKTVGLKMFDGIELDNEPTTKTSWFKKIFTKKDTTKINFLVPGMVKPVVFGTNTIFGLAIKWDNPSSPVPSAIKLGFNRKEMVYAPISSTKEGDTTKINIPSLLATMQQNVDFSKGGNLRWSQYFATGDAATNFALRIDVRSAMTDKLTPSSEKKPVGTVVADAPID